MDLEIEIHTLCQSKSKVTEEKSQKKDECVRNRNHS